MVAGVTMLCGCTGNIAYHDTYDDPTSPSPSQPDNLFENVNCGPATGGILGRSFSMGFIEFDDTGEVHDPRQVKRIIDYITNYQKDPRNKEGLVIITYLNGWQNNASINGCDEIKNYATTSQHLNDYKKEFSEVNGDVQKFKEFLALTANTPRVANGDVALSRPGKHLLGIYLGWRGELIRKTVEPITTLTRTPTYSDRHYTKDVIGNSEVLGRVMNDIQLAAKANEYNKKFNDDKPVTVLMGHSFGGAIVETLMDQWLQRIPTNTASVHRFADLVVVMNPASEAAVSFDIVSRLQKYENTAKSFYEDPPAFVAVTSDTDVATGPVFYAGAILVKWPQILSDSYRDLKKRDGDQWESLGVNQVQFEMRTGPNCDWLRNGRVDVADSSALIKQQAPAALKGSMAPAAYNAGEAPDKDQQEEPTQGQPPENGLLKSLGVLNTNLAAENPLDPANRNGLLVKDPLGGGVIDPRYYILLSNGTAAYIHFTSYQKDPNQPTSETNPALPGNKTRYWLLKVDKALIDGHGDVWGPNAMNLYARLFRLAMPERLDGKRGATNDEELVLRHGAQPANPNVY
jgi:pimeloyl-ACP methyl ester carboxylesterase